MARMMMGVGEALFGLCVNIRLMFDEWYEPEFPILITGKYK